MFANAVHLQTNRRDGKFEILRSLWTFRSHRASIIDQARGRFCADFLKSLSVRPRSKMTN